MANNSNRGGLVDFLEGLGDSFGSRLTPMTNKFPDLEIYLRESHMAYLGRKTGKYLFYTAVTMPFGIAIAGSIYCLSR